MAAAKRVPRYIKKTRGIKFTHLPQHSTSTTAASTAEASQVELALKVYVGADFAGAICWRSRIQRVTATSAVEAEYLAPSAAAKHHL